MIATAPHDTLQPRSPGGTAPGAAMSVLAHVALIAALAYGVNWRAPMPQTISAELWAAVPTVAAPAEVPPPAAPAREPEPARPAPVAKVAPPPALPDPQIAIEKARKEKAEQLRVAREEQARLDKIAREKAQRDQALRDRAEADRLRLEKERQLAAERAAAAEAARLAKLREDNLRRMMGQLDNPAKGTGAPGSTGSARVDAAPSASYGGRLVRAIKPNIVFTETYRGNPAAVVEVRSAPSGTILGSTLVKSSGDKAWDEAVLRAIERTAKLPPDTDGRVPATLTITFTPRD